MYCIPQLLERVVLSHPHHSVHVILALAHANKDMEVLLQRRKSTSRLAKASQDSDSQEEVSIREEVRHCKCIPSMS